MRKKPAQEPCTPEPIVKRMAELFTPYRDTPLRQAFRDVASDVEKSPQNQWLLRLMSDRLSHFELEMYNLCLLLEEKPAKK